MSDVVEQAKKVAKNRGVYLAGDGQGAFALLLSDGEKIFAAKKDQELDFEGLYENVEFIGPITPNSGFERKMMIKLLKSQHHALQSLMSVVIKLRPDLGDAKKMLDALVLEGQQVIQELEKSQID